MKTCLVVAGLVFHKEKLLLIKHRKLKKWLPPGGHIEENETPDDALLREIREETCLDVEILNSSSMPLEGNVKCNLRLPFYANVHNAGTHDHCCFFYVCRALNPEKLAFDKTELEHAAWFSRQGLRSRQIPKDVRNIGLVAFGLLGKLR